MSYLGDDKHTDNSRAIEYHPMPPPRADQKSSFRRSSPGRGFRRGSDGDGDGDRARADSRVSTGSSYRRPSVELDMNELYGSPDPPPIPLIEEMPASDRSGEREPESVFTYENPRRLSEPVTPPRAEKKHGTPEREAPSKKQSKQAAAPGHKIFSLSVLLGWAGKGKKRDDPDKAGAPSPSPSLSISKTSSSGTIVQEKKNQRTPPTLEAKEPAFNPHAPLLRFVSDKITVPGPPKPITLTTKSDVFAKAVILSMEAVSAARDMYTEEPFNDDLGIKLVTELEAVADIYKSFGDFGSGAMLLQESISLRQEKGLGNKQDVAVAMNDLGLIYCEVKRYAEAFNLFKEAFRLLEEHHGGPCLDAAACLGNAGVAMRGSRIYVDAITANDKAHAAMSSMAGAHHVFTLQQKAMLAMSLHPAGDVGLSMRMLKEVIEEFQSLDTPESDPYLKYLQFEYNRFVVSSPE